VPEQRFDVAIAGGGPAGASTALRLARAGFSVAVLESRRMPRFKPCGEFMSPECLPMLRELGVYDEVRAARRARGARHAAARARPARARPLRRLGARAARRATTAGPCGASASTKCCCAPRARGRRRRRRRAGASARARRTEPGRSASSREDAAAELVVRAAWTIGADGVRSRVAQELGVRREVPWLQKLALTTRYSGVDWGDRAEVHFFEAASSPARRSTAGW
jgi:flavin-dependent dehydrogenase